MPDLTSKPPSLVEVLRAIKPPARIDTRQHLPSVFVFRDDVLKIAAPYAARLAGLERAFAEAKVAQGRHGLVTAWRLLEDALAAVPRIEEIT